MEFPVCGDMYLVLRELFPLKSTFVFLVLFFCSFDGSHNLVSTAVNFGSGLIKMNKHITKNSMGYV